MLVKSLSDEGLRELFSAAKAFYRAELWLDFGDEVMFEIKLQPTSGDCEDTVWHHHGKHGAGIWAGALCVS